MNILLLTCRFTYDNIIRQLLPVSLIPAQYSNNNIDRGLVHPPLRYVFVKPLKLVRLQHTHIIYDYMGGTYRVILL